MTNEFEINSDRFARVRNARNTETAEDYTEMIADLIRETGEARAVDLAKHFGVTGSVQRFARGISPTHLWLLGTLQLPLIPGLGFWPLFAVQTQLGTQLGPTFQRQEKR